MVQAPGLSTWGGAGLSRARPFLASRDSCHCLLHSQAGWVSLPPPTSKCIKRPESYIQREEGVESSPA